MKLKEYIDCLLDISKRNPETLEMDIVYSVDDEWNEFKKVYYTPTVWNFNEKKWEFDDSSNSEKNSVCIN